MTDLLILCFVAVNFTSIVLVSSWVQKLKFLKVFVSLAYPFNLICFGTLTNSWLCLVGQGNWKEQHKLSKLILHLRAKNWIGWLSTVGNSPLPKYSVSEAVLELPYCSFFLSVSSSLPCLFFFSFRALFFDYYSFFTLFFFVSVISSFSGENLCVES